MPTPSILEFLGRVCNQGDGGFSQVVLGVRGEGRWWWGRGGRDSGRRGRGGEVRSVLLIPRFVVCLEDRCM